MKLPLLLKVLMFTAISYGVFGLYWENKFEKTYSQQQTGIKNHTLIEHGNTYYVNEQEYVTARFIRKSSWLWFIIVWGITFSYLMKNRPDYFKRRK